jgi:hypothetical protein
LTTASAYHGTKDVTEDGTWEIICDEPGVVIDNVNTNKLIIN